jgi:hypothetical protein
VVRLRLHRRVVATPARNPRRPPVKKFVLVALVGVVGALLLIKRQRDRELDEAIWEEPQDV